MTPSDPGSGVFHPFIRGRDDRNSAAANIREGVDQLVSPRQELVQCCSSVQLHGVKTNMCDMFKPCEICQRTTKFHIFVIHLL